MWPAMNETAGLWVVAIGATLFFAVLLATWRSWCECEEPEPPAPLTPEQSQRAALAALAALEPPPVAAVVLPCFPYARGRASESETLVCAICLEALRDGEACSEVPRCRHVFHGDCVGAWAMSKGSCPLCRAKIPPGSGGAAAAVDMV